MHPDVIYIDTSEKLQDACYEFNKQTILGVDIECENNLHHYGAYISIIQVSTKEQNYIIDVMLLKNIDSFLNILKDNNIEKIFHGCDFDLRILNTEFKTKVKNIFDTQIASQLIGIREFGLGSLLEHYLGVEKKDKFQMADWTKRPLTKDMLTYAVKDSMYMIKLKDILKNSLEKLGRLEIFKEECAYFENKEHILEKPTFFDLSGLREMEPRDLAVLKELYELRETYARIVNRPVHFIINTKKMKLISSKTDMTLNDWKTMKGVHPIVKRKADKFFDAYKKGLTKEIIIPKNSYKKLTKEQRNFMNSLDEKRKDVANKLDIEPFLILNKDQMLDITLTQNYNSLRNWQKKLIET